MGSVHPIKPRQRPVVFPLRRKRTVHWSADAASDNCPPRLPGCGPGNPVGPVRAPRGKPSPPHRPKRSRFVTPASAARRTPAPGAGGNGPKNGQARRATAGSLPVGPATGQAREGDHRSGWPAGPAPHGGEERLGPGRDVRASRPAGAAAGPAGRGWKGRPRRPGRRKTRPGGSRV